jgi:hypothetical protein
MQSSNDTLPFRFRNAAALNPSPWPRQVSARSIPARSIPARSVRRLGCLSGEAEAAAGRDQAAGGGWRRRMGGARQPGAGAQRLRRVGFRRGGAAFWEARDALAVLVWETVHGGASPQNPSVLPADMAAPAAAAGLVSWRPPLSGLGTPLVDHGRAEVPYRRLARLLRAAMGAAMLFPWWRRRALARALQAAIGGGGHLQHLSKVTGGRC